MPPADTPEQISPFTPPHLASENQETESGETPPRPSFGRANAEWLRRIQKTPPASGTSSASGTSQAPAEIPTPAPVSPSSKATEPPALETPTAQPARDTSNDWLRALDAEQAKAADTT